MIFSREDLQDLLRDLLAKNRQQAAVALDVIDSEQALGAADQLDQLLLSLNASEQGEYTADQLRIELNTKLHAVFKEPLTHRVAGKIQALIDLKQRLAMEVRVDAEYQKLFA